MGAVPEFGAGACVIGAFCLNVSTIGGGAGALIMLNWTGELQGPGVCFMPDRARTCQRPMYPPVTRSGTGYPSSNCTVVTERTVVNG